MLYAFLSFLTRVDTASGAALLSDRLVFPGVYTEAGGGFKAYFTYWQP